uniref:Uncharacterized protein n=1 Tax=Peronospora matthiolae TaxID=2874970 RepID=A0AAV1UYT3_9STRA
MIADVRADSEVDDVRQFQALSVPHPQKGGVARAGHKSPIVVLYDANA